MDIIPAKPEVRNRLRRLDAFAWSATVIYLVGGKAGP
jgi:hypothetical protein